MLKLVAAIVATRRRGRLKLVRAVVREPPRQTPLSELPDAIRPFDPLHLDACNPLHLDACGLVWAGI